MDNELITVTENAAPPPAASAPARQETLTGALLGSVQSLAATVAIAVFVITFIVQAFQIPSESMENTLLIGDYLLVDKVRYAPAGNFSGVAPYEPVRRGDIIVFRFPVNPDQHFVKRVVGLPGDRVRLIHKQVFVNGAPLREDYIVHSSSSRDHYRDDFPDPEYLNPQVEPLWLLQYPRLMKGHELVVPEGKYFVLGDNRDESLDSRYWGFVSRENVVGRPLLIYFSMERPLPMATSLNSFNDKLHHFKVSLSNLSERIRWNRTLRLIK